MLIDLSEILSTEGLTKSVEVHVGFDSFQFKGMDYRIGQADDFQLDLVMMVRTELRFQAVQILSWSLCVTDALRSSRELSI